MTPAPDGPDWATAAGIRAAAKPRLTDAPASTEAHLWPSRRRSRWSVGLGAAELGAGFAVGAALGTGVGSAADPAVAPAAPGRPGTSHRASLEIIAAIASLPPVFDVAVVAVTAVSPRGASGAVRRAVRQARMTKSAPSDHCPADFFRVIHRPVIHKQVDKSGPDDAVLALVVVEC